LWVFDFFRFKDGRGPLLPQSGSYKELYANFKFSAPKILNMGVSVCDRHVTAGYGEDTAIIMAKEDGDEIYTFNHLRDFSNKLANALRGMTYM